MAFPTVTVQAAWATAPFATTPTWTDISTYVLSGTTSRGRSSNLSRVDAGSLALPLDDADHRFDPFNTGSAYYPNVKPAKKVRVSCVFNAVTYYLWTGHNASLKPDWRKPSYTEVSLQAKDAFSLLALASLPGASYPAELSGARVGRVLDAVGWPAADRVLDTGRCTMAAATIADGDDTKALAHLLDVAESELGIFFIDGQGRAVFHDMYHRIDAPADYTSLATLGDGGGSELDWDEIGPDFDVEKIVNDWRLTPSGGSTVTKTDSTSITDYGRRSQARSPFITDVNQVTAQAEYLLGQTKDPALRFDRLVLRPSDLQAGSLQNDLFAQALGREIGDRITVKARPPDGSFASYTISQDVIIEGISHAFSDQSWETTFLLSPADPNTVAGGGYWILGDATYSLLGVTTRLAP